MDTPSPCSNTHSCPCLKTQCPRHGRCCECIAHVRKDGDLPDCLKPPKES